MKSWPYAIKFLLALIALFVLVLSVLFYRSHLLNKEYPMLMSKEQLNDTVLHIVSDGRGSARITFNSKLKRTLPWAKNLQYTQEPSLTRMIKEGDVLVKKTHSDTIQLKRLDEVYIFVIHKTIE